MKQKGKGAGGSATLSTAYAAAEFVNGVMAAESGAGDVVFCAYVNSDEFRDADFFASPIKFGVRPSSNVGYALAFNLRIEQISHLYATYLHRQ